jgi:hypothetical protein
LELQKKKEEEASKAYVTAQTLYRKELDLFMSITGQSTYDSDG